MLITTWIQFMIVLSLEDIFTLSILMLPNSPNPIHITALFGACSLNLYCFNMMHMIPYPVHLCCCIPHSLWYLPMYFVQPANYLCVIFPWRVAQDQSSLAFLKMHSCLLSSGRPIILNGLVKLLWLLELRQHMVLKMQVSIFVLRIMGQGLNLIRPSLSTLLMASTSTDTVTIVVLFDTIVRAPFLSLYTK